MLRHNRMFDYLFRMMTGQLYQFHIEPATVAYLLGAGLTLTGGVVDFFSRGADRESQEDLTEAGIASREKMHGEDLAFRRQQEANTEKQRGFKRLVDMLGTGNTLTNQAAGAARLRSIRSAGTGKNPYA